MLWWSWTYLYSFLKKFPKIIWALFPPPGGFCPPFSNSSSHAPYPHIFSQLSTLFTLPSSRYPPPDDRYSLHLTSTPLAGIPTYNITPTPSYASRWRSPLIVVVQSTIPIFTAAPTHHVRILNNLIYLFQKNNFSKKFLGPFHGPPGLMTPIFEFPFSRYIPSNFFPPLHLNSRFTEAVDTYLQLHPYTKTY